MNVSMIMWSLCCSFPLISVASAHSSFINPDNFIQCLSTHQLSSSSNVSVLSVLYAPSNTSYLSILDSSISNYRFLSPDTPKPLFVITPLLYSHVQVTVVCAKRNGLQIRTRSGGHDFEGLSYRSQVQFVILDLRNLRSITVDFENESAWVESGARIGKLYYSIAEKSPVHGFPAGTVPVVGVGGHFSGGGNGYLVRKYGLAADNVINAIIVDYKGRILDKNSMGDDLFWAIRGGGGSSFGVILSWKIKLVRVPSIVTVVRLTKTFEQGAVDLIHELQYVGSKLVDDLCFSVVIQRSGPTRSPNAVFNALFLGRSDRLLEIMEQNFPELQLTKQDCTEMSWIESVLSLSEYPDQSNIKILKNASYSPFDSYIKLKSDFVYNPLPYEAVQQLWNWSSEVDFWPRVQMHFYGGIMERIPESQIPFPHRKGVIFELLYMGAWFNGTDSNQNIDQVRGLEEILTPYVSCKPRRAYLNCVDLDLGTNDPNGGTSYYKAEEWGSRYFHRNFRRLAIVKGKVDPTNFFSNEQSIPPLVRIKCIQHKLY